MKYSWMILFVLLPLLVLSSCASGKSREPLVPGQIGGGDVVLVGKVRFTPAIVYDKPVDQKDQKRGQPSTPSTDALVGILVNKDSKVLDLNINDRLVTLPVYEDLVTQNQTFVVKTETASALYFRGFYLYINDYYAINSKGGNRFYINAAAFEKKLRITVPAGAKAVYIGTIDITRNDQYQGKTYKIVDEYDDAKKDFVARFPGWELVRADVKDLDE